MPDYLPSWLSHDNVEMSKLQGRHVKVMELKVDGSRREIFARMLATYFGSQRLNDERGLEYPQR